MCSSISSVLNAMTALTWDDFLKRFVVKSSTSKEMWILKIVGIVFGVAAIASAFLAKHMGSIIQTNFTLSGSVKGPLLGIFLVSALFQSANPKGLIVGLISGQLSCLVVVVLGLIYPKPKAVLHTSTSECYGNSTQSFQTYQPAHIEDVYWFHYISNFLVPFIGNVVTIVVSIVISKLTGSNKDSPVDQIYMSPLVRKKVVKCLDSPQGEEMAALNTEKL